MRQLRTSGMSSGCSREHEELHFRRLEEANKVAASKSEHFLVVVVVVVVLCSFSAIFLAS